MPSKRRVAKCSCGCGQAPAETTRLRKASCAWCGYIIRLSRDCISRGLPGCPCGGTLEPDCLHDACAAPGELGAAAYSELCARDDMFALRSANVKRRALGQMRCPGIPDAGVKCNVFRKFGSSCDPTHIEPCPRCGSEAPATFAVPRKPKAEACPF